MDKSNKMVFCSHCKKKIDIVLHRCADANICSRECGYARLNNIKLYDPNMVEPRNWHDVDKQQRNILYVPNFKKTKSYKNIEQSGLIDIDVFDKNISNEKIIDEDNDDLINNKEIEKKIKKMIVKKALCILCLVSVVVLNIGGM